MTITPQQKNVSEIVGPMSITTAENPAGPLNGHTRPNSPKEKRITGVILFTSTGQLLFINTEAQAFIRTTATTIHQ